MNASRLRFFAIITLLCAKMAIIGFGAESMDALYKKAVTGDAESQFLLGANWHFGHQGKTNLIEAVRWYRMAADNGHEKAQFNLGRCYEDGVGVDRNYTEAHKWYSKAALQNNSSAQHALGDVYQNGQGVPKDNLEAVKWFRKAADQGHAAAQYCLGKAYADGLGVAKDDATASIWMRKAADQGEAYAKAYLARTGSGVPKTKMDLSGVMPMGDVDTLYPKAVNGDAEAQFALGHAWYHGDGVQTNLVEAIKWYQMAAEKGHMKAQHQVGACYFEGKGVAQNYSEAAKWFRLSALQNSPLSQFSLGQLYANGLGVEKNVLESIRWYSKSARQGFVSAQFELGEIYANGEGVTQNYEEAVGWYRMAAQHDYPQGQFCLGMLYGNGYGVKKDDLESERWIRKAAEQGNARAQYRLGLMYDSGVGLAKDPTEAVKWIRMAADQGNNEAESYFAMAQHPVPESGNILFVTDVDKPATADKGYLEVSIRNPHKAVVRLQDLTPGKTYVVRYSLRDAASNEVFTNATMFTPTSTLWLLTQNYQPNKTTQKPGKWTWIADISGVAHLTTEVRVLDGTPLELDTMAMHEKAAEQVYRVFANYWMAADGKYLTKLLNQDIQTEVARSTVWVNVETGQTLTTRPEPAKWFGRGEPRYVEKQVLTTNVIGADKFLYLQIDRPAFTWSRSDLSDADRLNGIKYRGSARVDFALYRMLDPKKGVWEDWRDSTHYFNQFAAAIGRLWGPRAPAHLKNQLNLNFVIIKRDGNWFVETDSQERFANGKKIQSGAATLSEPPTPQLAEALLNTSEKRDVEKLAGDSVRSDPAALERSIMETMRQLRPRQR